MNATHARASIPLVLALWAAGASAVAQKAPAPAEKPVARALLEVTDLGIGEIALALAYSTHAAFDAAFRRWSGMSPQKWRMALQPR